MSIKIHNTWNDDIRKIPFNSGWTIEEFRACIVKLYALKNLAGISIRYCDEDGDKITLSTIEELSGLVEKNNGTAKLFLERKVNKPVQAATIQVPKKDEFVIIESDKTETAETEKKAPKSNSEKEKCLRKQIVKTQAIRLRWKTPEIKEGENPCWKGCFIGATANGKIKFNAGRGKNGVWLIRELKNNDIVLAPLVCPSRHLRVFPDGKVNLTKAGAGPRARWSLTKGNANITLGDLQKNDSIRLESKFVPDFVFGVNKFFNKNNKLKMKLRGENKSTIETNVDTLAHTYTVELVDPLKMLVKVTSNFVQRRKAIKEVMQSKRCRGVHSSDFENATTDNESPKKKQIKQNIAKQLKKIEKKRADLL